MTVGSLSQTYVAFKQFHHTTTSHLHVPLLAHGVDHTALDGPPAGTADGDAHLIVAGQAVEFTLQLPGVGGQLLTAHTQTHHFVLKPLTGGGGFISSALFSFKHF